MIRFTRLLQCSLALCLASVLSSQTDPASPTEKVTQAFQAAEFDMLATEKRLETARANLAQMTQTADRAILQQDITRLERDVELARIRFERTRLDLREAQLKEDTGIAAAPRTESTRTESAKTAPEPNEATRTAEAGPAMTVLMGREDVPPMPSIFWAMGVTPPCGEFIDRRLVSAGYHFLTFGDQKAAKKCFDKFLKPFERDLKGQTPKRNDPLDGRFWAVIGDALRGLARFEEALGAYKKAASLDAYRRSETEFGLAETYAALGDFASALPHNEAAIALIHETEMHERYHYFRQGADVADKVGRSDLRDQFSRQARYFADAYRSFYGFMQAGSVSKGFRNLALYYEITGTPELARAASKAPGGYRERYYETELEYISGSVGYAASRPSLISMILRGTSEALGEAAGTMPPGAAAPQAGGSGSTLSLSCPDWSPRLQLLLQSETDPRFRQTLESQKNGQERVIDMVARSGGLAEAKRLSRLQIEDYTRQLREQGAETALGHAEVRQRLLRSVEYNEAVSELLNSCVLR